MSYSLSANPDIDIPANEQPAKPQAEIYACAYSAWLPTPNGGESALGCCYIAATRKSEAKLLGESLAREIYKECDGYLLHDVLVTMIKPEDLAKIGYHR